LTNPPNDTPLRPGSTFIDGFSKLIPQRIAVENAHENPSINVESGRNGLVDSSICTEMAAPARRGHKCSILPHEIFMNTSYFHGFVNVHPNGCFCSERSHFSLSYLTI